jgi:hypothetical protein
MSAIWNSNSKSETARRPRTDGGRLLLHSETDEQSIERLDLHAIPVADRCREQFEPLRQAEERLLLIVYRDCHDHFIEQLPRALDDVEVAIRDRIESYPDRSRVASARRFAEERPDAKRQAICRRCAKPESRCH